MDIASEIRDSDDRFEKAFAGGDTVAIAELYCEDAQLLPPGSRISKGRAGARAYWKRAMMMGAATIKLETAEVEDLGDAAIELGRYSLTDKKGADLEIGKYLVVWRREHGILKLHRDIWNSDGA